MRAWIGVAALALAAACTSQAPPPPPPQVVEAPRPAPPPPPPAAPSPPRDACGASKLQYLIGKPRTDIPIPVDPSRRRVVCSSCMITQDYISTRQTIVYDSDTGLVREVRCG